MTTEETIIEPENSLPEVSAADLTERMQTAIASAGWASLTPVQSKSIAYLMAGRDMMVQARTGSGKTGAFVLPLLERLNLELPAVQALILVPTRELAQQVSAETEMLGKSAGLKVAAIYGGKRYKQQLDALRNGAHVVVGTPGRILDHLGRGTLTFDELVILTFDEADRMLSMGFRPDLEEIRRYLPKRSCDTFMFSATFPPYVNKLASLYMDDPGFLSLSRDQVHVTDIDHLFVAIKGMEKDRTLAKLVEVENPSGAMIFCNTKMRVEYVTVVLRRFGYNADMLTSDLSQNQRERILQQLRDGQLRFLVATDIAARGIDIPELSHVFQYEPPEDPEQYIHRAGRTGRAGSSGRAFTLVEPLERMKLRKIGQKFNIEFEEMASPTDEAVAAIVAERAEVLLETKLRKRDNLKTERMARFRPMAAALAQDDDGLDLLAMLLDDAYHQSAHEPPAEVKSQALKSQDSKKSRGSSNRRGGGNRRRSRSKK